MSSAGRLERVKGIEPSYEAWEAAVLPLNYTRLAPAKPLLATDGGFRLLKRLQRRHRLLEFQLQRYCSHV